MDEEKFEASNIYVFAKDAKYRFIFCNEKLAEAANLDSPTQIVGKTDVDLCWKDKSDFYRQIDFDVMNNNCAYVNVFEHQKLPGKEVDILVTKNQLMNKSNKCIGVIGSYVDITGYFLVKKIGCFNEVDGRFYFGNEYFTRRELEIFKHILLGKTSKKIALNLKLSNRTVENYIETIKNKLQCSAKGDIIATAIKSGLAYLIFQDNFILKEK